MRRLGAELAFIVGAGLASFGAWLAWHPAGYMLGGVLLMLEALAAAILMRATERRR